MCRSRQPRSGSGPAICPSRKISRTLGIVLPPGLARRPSHRPSLGARRRPQPCPPRLRALAAAHKVHPKRCCTDVVVGEWLMRNAKSLTLGATPERRPDTSRISLSLPKSPTPHSSPPLHPHVDKPHPRIVEPAVERRPVRAIGRFGIEDISHAQRPGCIRKPMLKPALASPVHRIARLEIPPRA